MKILKYSLLLLCIGMLSVACERNDDIFPDIQKGANVRLIKSPDFPIFINAEDIPGSRIVIDGYSENDNISTVELFVTYTSGSLDSVFTNNLLTTVRGSEITNGELPALNFSTQDIADAVSGLSLSDMGAGDKIDIINVTTLDDGRVYPDTSIPAGTQISDNNGDGVPDTTFLSLNTNIAPSISAGAEASFTTMLTYFIACPFNVADAVGEYLITRDDFETSLDYDTPIQAVEVDENTVRFENLFMHPEMFDVSIDVDLASGQATVIRQPAWHCDNFGCGFGEGRVDGGGFFLSCVGFVTLDLTHTVDAGSFGTFKLELQKQ